MMPKYIYSRALSSIVFFAAAFSASIATAADFHKTYDNAANRRITIFTLHGDIKLSGYDGKDIDVSAVKKGPDSDRVEVEDASFGNHIYIFPKYLESEKNNATVDFEIRVPKEIFYNTDPVSAKPSKPQAKPQERPKEKPQPGPAFSPPSQKFPDEQPAAAPPGGMQAPHSIFLKSNSGQITVSDVRGSIRVETGGRNIEMQNVEGVIFASSFSGDIKGSLKQSSHRSVLRFSSVSGNISVQAPDDISAQVHIQSGSGQVKTDFPLETRDMRYGPGKFIQGKLGAGDQMLNIQSVSGAINFSKKPSETKEK